MEILEQKRKRRDAGVCWVSLTCEHLVLNIFAPFSADIVDMRTCKRSVVTV